MSPIRTTKSIEALSASLNRALAGVRQPQVVAAQRAQLRHVAGAAGPANSTASTAATSSAGSTGSPGNILVGPPGRSDGFIERLASRRRTNLMIGTLDRLRQSPASSNTTRRDGL